MSEEKSEKLNLWWVHPETSKRHYAGVAFFEENYDEYRLKIDSLPDGKRYYIRPIGTVGDRVNYRIEYALNINGRFVRRIEAGDGYCSPETDGDIYIDLGPYTKTLVLEAKGVLRNA